MIQDILPYSVQRCKVKKARGDVNRKEWDTVRDWSYFEQYNSNMIYEDTQLKELIKNKK